MSIINRLDLSIPQTCQPYGATLAENLTIEASVENEITLLRDLVNLLEIREQIGLRDAERRGLVDFRHEEILDNLMTTARQGNTTNSEIDIYLNVLSGLCLGSIECSNVRDGQDRRAALGRLGMLLALRGALSTTGLSASTHERLRTIEAELRSQDAPLVAIGNTAEAVNRLVAQLARELSLDGAVTTEMVEERLTQRCAALVPAALPAPAVEPPPPEGPEQGEEEGEGEVADEAEPARRSVTGGLDASTAGGYEWTLYGSRPFDGTANLQQGPVLAVTAGGLLEIEDIFLASLDWNTLGRATDDLQTPRSAGETTWRLAMFGQATDDLWVGGAVGVDWDTLVFGVSQEEQGPLLFLGTREEVTITFGPMLRRDYNDADSVSFSLDVACLALGGDENSWGAAAQVSGFNRFGPWANDRISLGLNWAAASRWIYPDNVRARGQVDLGLNIMLAGELQLGVNVFIGLSYSNPANVLDLMVGGGLAVFWGAGESRLTVGGF